MLYDEWAVDVVIENVEDSITLSDIFDNDVDRNGTIEEHIEKIKEIFWKKLLSDMSGNRSFGSMDNSAHLDCTHCGFEDSYEHFAEPNWNQPEGFSDDFRDVYLAIRQSDLIIEYDHHRGVAAEDLLGLVADMITKFMSTDIRYSRCLQGDVLCNPECDEGLIFTSERGSIARYFVDMYLAEMEHRYVRCCYEFVAYFSCGRR